MGFRQMKPCVILQLHNKLVPHAHVWEAGWPSSNACALNLCHRHPLLGAHPPKNATTLAATAMNSPLETLYFLLNTSASIVVVNQVGDTHKVFLNLKGFFFFLSDRDPTVLMVLCEMCSDNLNTARHTHIMILSHHRSRISSSKPEIPRDHT